MWDSRAYQEHVFKVSALGQDGDDDPRTSHAAAASEAVLSRYTWQDAAASGSGAGGASASLIETLVSAHSLHPFTCCGV